MIMEGASGSRLGACQTIQFSPDSEVKITGTQSQAARSAAFTPLHGSQGYVHSDNAATSSAEAA
jgi:hypothetical protein